MSSSRAAAPIGRSPTSVAASGGVPGALKNNNNNKPKDGAPEENNNNSAPTSSKQVTPPKQQTQSKKKQRITSNNTTTIAKPHPDMIVSKPVIDELLLVCGVIGSTTINPNTNQEEFVPVTDAMNWLQDLQRCLKRDHEIYRPISLKLGSWRVVSTKLLPLVMSCRFDRNMVMTVCKILVILTKPMSESAKKAGRMSVDVKSGKVDPE